ncbi:hypothetical protein CPB86DRAFT_780473 [Serendipita vermifera]|nr:hypothetical protein CPB86DRAFT_780473 [Serendipita vermifera]
MLSSSSPLGVGSPLLYGYQPQTGFDSYQSLNAFSFNASTSTSSSSTGSGGYDSTPSSASTLSMGMGMTTAADDGLMMMGALGLSNDFFAQTDYSATGAMSFTLPPPPSTAPAKPMPLITTTTNTAPSTPSPSSTSIAQQQQDSDPLQIHYDSCSLLLQSILSSSSSSSVEETLQRLTSKFSSMITNPSISSSPSMAPLTTAVKPEYLFSATLAGALCPKNSYRRDLFRRVVRGIEERQLGPGAVGEAGLLLDQI